MTDMSLRSLGGFTAAHDRWLSESKVAASSRSGHEHRVLCRALTFAMESDGLNIANLASFEFLIRRRMLLEAAHRDDPERPALEGSHIYMGEEEGTGVTVTPALRAHVASEMAKEAAIEKEKTKAREAKAEAKAAAARSKAPPPAK